MFDNKLAQHFKFTESDLEANRKGYFSEAQNNKLSGRHSGAVREKRLAVMISFPLGLGLLGWMSFLIFRAFALNGKLESNDFATILFTGIFGAPLLLASIYIFRLSLIQQKYLLKKAEGSINIIKNRRVRDNRSFISYELHINGKTFSVNSDLGDLMIQGDTYAIYYSEGTVNNMEEILSVELLSTATSSQ